MEQHWASRASVPYGTTDSIKKQFDVKRVTGSAKMFCLLII